MSEELTEIKPKREMRRLCTSGTCAYPGLAGKWIEPAELLSPASVGKIDILWQVKV